MKVEPMTDKTFRLTLKIAVIASIALLTVGCDFFGQAKFFGQDIRCATLTSGQMALYPKCRQN